ncbi:hypothetical protein DV737_g40, partial [Chaetothyriales sp. CBS 132003]
MKSVAALALALASSVVAQSWGEWSSSVSSATPTPVSWTSSVVTAVTTYVPSASVFSHAGKTYTATGPSLITITDCPCTISVPVYISTSTSCSESIASSSPVSVKPSSAWGTGVPSVLASGSIPYATAASGYAATSVAATSVAWTPVAATTSSWQATYTGGASKAGIGLAAVVGAAALLL